jgi:hypothetical protein
MFHTMRNAANSGTRDLRTVLDQIRRRLPGGWRVALAERGGRRRVLVVEAPDGRRAEVEVRLCRQVAPRDVLRLVSSAEGGAGTLLVARYLSPRSRELLADAGASYADATGNLRLSLGDPAVFLEGRGDDRDPGGAARALKSLKGAAAGRVVRAVCDFNPPSACAAWQRPPRLPSGRSLACSASSTRRPW